MNIIIEISKKLTNVLSKMIISLKFRNYKIPISQKNLFFLFFFSENKRLDSCKKLESCNF